MCSQEGSNFIGGPGKCSVFMAYTLQQILCKLLDAAKREAHSILEVMLFKTSTSANAK